MPIKKPWWRGSKQCYYVWHDGRQVRLDPDEQEAYRLWHLLALGGETRPGGPTVAWVVDAFLASLPGRVSAGTISSRRAPLLALKRDHGGLSACALTAAVALEWISSKKTWGRSYRWYVGSIVKTAMRWAQAEGLVEGYELGRLRLPGARSRGKGAVVASGDHERLMAAAPADVRDLLLCIQQTGCRPGEACRVTAADFDPDAMTWTLATHKGSRKSDAPRVIHLTPAVAEVCSRLAGLRPTGPLFRNGAGLPATAKSLGSWLNKACRRLGVKATGYGYRHTLATDALAAGLPEAHVAELLGHKGTAMLHKHYSHLSGRGAELKASLSRVRE